MMTKVREVADKVYHFEPPITGMPQKPVVYLIQEDRGALIDPGPAAALPSILGAMSYLGMKDLSYIIPTHIHVDHGGGTGEMAKQFPQAKVVVHPRGVKHLLTPARLIESTKLVWGDDFEERLGPITPVPESQLEVPPDGGVISLGGRDLQIIHALGHSPNHIVILDRKLNGLFCGEALGLPGHQLPPVAPYSYEQEIYLETIEKLRELRPKILFYSHGGVEREPDKSMSRAADNARTYGRMILECLKMGESHEDIMRSVREDAAHRLGLLLEPQDLEIAVAGYTIYFQSKGLI
jgi:glyoxylase-like metal-dependent hydrolase (beta-lactamase superfamily II)